jgi:hypothetical protein
MKYISLIVVLVLMSWTWSIATAERDFSLDQHRELEAQVENLVTEQISQKYPTATEIKFQQLYTEVIHPKREIHVHMKYSYDDATTGGDKTSQGFERVLILVSNDGENWTTSGQDVQSQEIEFKEGLHISTKSDEPMNETPAEEAESPEAATPGAPETQNAAPQTAPAEKHHGE